MAERILVVDDDELVLTSVHILLEREGFDVRCFERGGPALDTVEREAFDLAILDVRMPGISGIEVLDCIRKLEETEGRPHLPVLILTGFADEDTPVDALRLAADDYLLKPFERAEFLTTVKRLLAKGQRTKDRHAYTENLEDRIEETTAELESSREQLRHASRLATVGQLSASVAHELNSPLAVIASYADLIIERLEVAGEGSPDFKDSMKLILDEAERCGTMVKNLLRFAGDAPAKYEPVDVRAVLHKTLVILGHSLRVAGIELNSELPTGLPWINGSESQLQQVFTNILLNAKNAMPEGGSVAINAIERAGETGDPMVEISFSDTGAGIVPEDLEKIFRAFFTTKPSATSMGLGLSICREIIVEHRGTIEVNSEVGEGATFTIRLPVATQQK